MAKPPRTEPWYVKIQLGNWVGHVFMPPTLDPNEAHRIILEAAIGAADDANAAAHQ